MNVPYNWNTHELAFLLQFVPGQKKVGITTKIATAPVNWPAINTARPITSPMTSTIAKK